ncbi:disintegrin and metalloproteinase domain-containing protein 10-like [Ornithodoros turicata]|uniref:disintegrin and metalloproteinase domain-containing protein 10-like n=1 Tax=Ornithodoros turicata TaxID=34597 RepID=UPI0031393D7C
MTGILSLWILMLYLPPLGCGRKLNIFVRHFEPLSYNRLAIHGKHVRTKRTPSDDQHIHIRIRGFKRYFHLRLVPDTSMFHKDFIMETTTRGVVPADISHIYSGHIAGQPDSLAYGALHTGVFEGKIQTANDTFYFESARKFFDRPTSFHSVMYSEKDVSFPQNKKTGSFCGLHGATEQWMDRILEQSSPYNRKELIGRSSHSPWYRRHLLSHDTENLESTKSDTNSQDRNATRRSAEASRRACNLEINVDHTLYEKISQRGMMDSQQTREQISSLIATHLHKVNQIYPRTNFDGVEDIMFTIHRVKINDSSNCIGMAASTNPFCSNAIDAGRMLHLLSLINHDDFCLSYEWSYREYSDGVLGLAWIARPQFGSGGICEKQKTSFDSGGGTLVESRMSLNTGVVTFLNFNSHVPLRVSEITFAHEIGHNFGSPHDDGKECAPGKPFGNYIMFASASRGNRRNNDKFSRCSIANISRIVVPLFRGESARENCFQESVEAICGNIMTEGKEQCDCGVDESECRDRCCYPRHNAGNHPGCTLRPDANCSPSSGLCCSDDCALLPRTTVCGRETDCAYSVTCDGISAKCPKPNEKANMTLCNNDTMVCVSGDCTGSICTAYGMESCSLMQPEYPREDLCLIACKNANGQCRSACDFPKMKHQCGKYLTPGTPCNELTGYCDVFHRCRAIDAEGALTKLNDLLFGSSPKSLLTFLKEHVFVSLLLVAGLVFIFALCFRYCAVHTPSNNPRKEPVYVLKTKLRSKSKSSLMSRSGSHYSASRYSAVTDEVHR